MGAIGIFGALSLLFLLLSEDRKTECQNCLHFDHAMSACCNGRYERVKRDSTCKDFRRGKWKSV